MNSNASRERSGATHRQKATLIGGYLALSVGLLFLARPRPAEYELSIYAEVPTAFWLGVGVAVVVAVALALRERNSHSRTRDASLLLAMLGVLSIVSLPLLQSYHFYGAGDSLSHLGWAREIQAA